MNEFEITLTGTHFGRNQFVTVSHPHETIFNIEKLPDDIMMKNNLRLEIIDASIIRGTANLLLENNDNRHIQTVLVNMPHITIDSSVNNPISYRDDNDQVIDQDTTEVLIDNMHYELISSGHRTAEFNAWNILYNDWTVEDDPREWQTLENYNPITGDYIGTNSLGGVAGEWIKLKLPISITIRWFRLQNGTKQIKECTFLGSKDDVNWTIIDTRSNWYQPFELRHGAYQNNNHDFKYYALVVTKIEANSTYGALRTYNLFGLKKIYLE